MKKELQYFKIEQAENHKNRIYSIWNEDETLSPSQVVRY